MTKYEYRFADLHAGAGRAMLDELNALGAEGWRAVDFDADTTAHWRVIMERELPDEEKDNGRKAKALGARSDGRGTPGSPS